MSGKLSKFLLWGGIPLVLFAVFAFVQANNNAHTFRYRLSFAVEVDGEVRSASSIIEAWYLKMSMPNAAGATGTASHKGVAPVIDLGENGYLIAALSAYCHYPDKLSVEKGLYPFSSSKEYGQVCKRAVSATELPKAFGLGYGRELEQLRQGKRELADDNYPAFIWIAKGASWRHTKRICPEEFASVIGADVRLRSISIEAVPEAPLIHRLEIQAPWIDEMRADKAQNKRNNLFGIPDFCSTDITSYEW